MCERVDRNPWAVASTLSRQIAVELPKPSSGVDRGEVVEAA